MFLSSGGGSTISMPINSTGGQGETRLVQAQLATNLNAGIFVAGNSNTVYDTVGTGDWKFYVAGGNSISSITASSTSTEWTAGNLLSYNTDSPIVLNYEFDTANQVGSTIQNLATNDYALTLTNGASIATASPAPYSPGYLSMNISSGQYATATVPFSLSRPWSISFWHRNSGSYITGGTVPTVFEIGNTTGFGLRIEGSVGFRSLVSYKNGTPFDGYYYSNLNDTSWTHYVIIYNTGFAAHINGSSVPFQSGSPNFNVATNYTYINFGKSNMSSVTTPTGGSYVINIDKFQIFNKVLSVDEIASLYGNTLSVSGNPMLKDTPSGVMWKPISATAVDATETLYTVKSNEIALTPGTNSTFAVWTAPKNTNIRVDVSFADYHTRNVGVGFQMFKINSDNTFGSLIFPRTVTSAALTNAAPTNYLSVPSTNLSVAAGDKIYYRIDANGNTTSASSVLATNIYSYSGRWY